MSMEAGASEERARLKLVTETGREYEGLPVGVDVKADGTWLNLEDCTTRRPSSGIRTFAVRLESCESVALPPREVPDAH